MYSCLSQENFPSEMPKKGKVRFETPPSGQAQSSSVARHPRRALDLFSGTGSVGQRLKEWGFEVHSLDVDPNSCAEICVDIIKWKYRNVYPPHFFDLIVAGVPCQEYSRAKTVGIKNYKLADSLVKKTLEIIDYFDPPAWWIENPQTGDLKDRPFMKGIPFIDVDYCQFSEMGFRKPTRIWCSDNISHLFPVKCDKINCPNSFMKANGQIIHQSKLGGNEMEFSSKQKGKMPRRLIDYLLSGICSTPPPLHYLLWTGKSRN